MIRPTPGREMPATVSRPSRTLPALVASALDSSGGRGPRGIRTAGPPVPVPGPGVVHGAPSALGALAPDTAPTGPAPAARADRPGPARMVLVPPADPDTPGPAEDHLNGVTDAEVARLWAAFHEPGGPGERRRLIEFYTPLVRRVAGKLGVRLPSSVELADLVQSGMFGLMEAVDRYEPGRGVRFEGYAAQRIRGAMLDELRAQDWVPRAVRARGRELERAGEAVRLRLGREATDRELAAELGIGLRELALARRPIHMISAEDGAGARSASGVSLELLVDDSAPDPVTAAVRGETLRELCAAVAELGERDQLVLRMYYLENRTLAEIGSSLGVTESRVCQLHSRMVLRLRARLAREHAC